MSFTSPTFALCRPPPSFQQMPPLDIPSQLQHNRFIAPCCAPTKRNMRKIISHSSIIQLFSQLSFHLSSPRLCDHFFFSPSEKLLETIFPLHVFRPVSGEFLALIKTNDWNLSFSVSWKRWKSWGGRISQIIKIYGTCNSLLMRTGVKDFSQLQY